MLSAPQQIAVPAYFDPSLMSGRGDWDRTDNGVPTVGFAVMNPNSGPSTDPGTIAAYVEQVQRSHDAGLLVLGYVATSGAARSRDDVKADVNTYYTLYIDADGTSVVDGIFFDVVTNDCTDPNDPAYSNSHIAYYQDLSTYVKGQDSNALVVLNPGILDPTLPGAGECYVNILPDIILVTFEGFSTDYLTNYTAPPWVNTYTADHFWHIIHDTLETDVQHVIDMSRQRNAGYVYVTSHGQTNPCQGDPNNTYCALPDYFEQEIQFVNS